MNKHRKVESAVVVIGVVVALVFVTGIVRLSPSTSSEGYAGPLKVATSACVRLPGYILIVADLSGFNDSIAHGAPSNPWPVVHVNQGDEVRILVCNEDSSQPHGFAVQTYFDRGVAILPGQAYRIEFTATLPGTFVVYCNIFCTVHIFMLGRLIVSD